MSGIVDIVADPDVLLQLSPEEIGGMLIRLIRDDREPMFFPTSMNTWIFGGDDRRRQEQHPRYAAARSRVSSVLMEGWEWLRANGLIMPAEDSNGRNGWMVLTRAGARLSGDDDFRSYAVAARFPKSLLHPSIADKVWLDLARGDLSGAVFVAFRAVEEAVRAAGGYGPRDIGLPLMRAAFDKNSGPLADMTQPESEREALAHMFAGAFGSYKNPHSHRTVTINDPTEAQEMVVLASHLLRIVDDRSDARGRNNRGAP